MSLNEQQISLQVGEKLREIATRQGNVPFARGDLRKSHVVEPYGSSGAILSVGMPYGRAVHNGRPAITIRPRRKKALMWSGASHPVKAVKQPAREGDPWLARAVDQLRQEGLGFLAPQIGEMLADQLTDALRGQGLEVRRS